MARTLRAWDSPSERGRAAEDANTTITSWQARHSQDRRNKSLKRDLRRSQRKLESAATRATAAGVRVKKQHAALESSGKSVTRSGTDFQRWGQQEAARQQREQAAEAASFTRTRDRAQKTYYDKLAGQGRLNKKDQIPLALQRKFNNSWDARWAQSQKGNTASAQSAYQQRLSAYQRQQSAYQRQQSAYRRTAQAQKKATKRYNRAERKYGKARKAYESGYYQV